MRPPGVTELSIQTRDRGKMVSGDFVKSQHAREVLKWDSGPGHVHDPIVSGISPHSGSAAHRAERLLRRRGGGLALRAQLALAAACRRRPDRRASGAQPAGQSGAAAFRDPGRRDPQQPGARMGRRRNTCSASSSRSSIPIGDPAAASVIHGASLLLAFLAISYLHVVLGEVVPKNLAIATADRLAVTVAPALLVFYRISHRLRAGDREIQRQPLRICCALAAIIAPAAIRRRS